MNCKAYRVYNPETRRVTESRNVIYIETLRPTLYTRNNNDDAGDLQEDNSS